MLRKVVNVIKLNSSRYYVTTPKVVISENVRGVPLITCKRTEFNLFSNDKRNENAKFGEISLASDGWGHRKSKGDNFTINALAAERENSKEMTEISMLKQFNMSESLIENIRTELEIQYLTSIQNSSIPIIMDMNHVLIAAETGCGKTLAYLLPIIHQVMQKKNKIGQRTMNTPLALILTPGRELASQVADVATKLTKNLGLSIKTILGGHTKRLMTNPDFSDVDILIGTIGAISKLTTTGIYRMNQVRHVVLDEADTLLDDSFSDKLCYFLKKFPIYPHNLLDTPNFRTKININNEETSFTLLKFRATPITASRKIRKLRFQQRKCRFMDESNLDHFAIYSKSLCETECKIKSILNACDCIPFFYKRLKGEMYCNTQGLKCAAFFKDKINKAVSECHCYSNCEDTIFTVEEYHSVFWMLPTALRIELSNTKTRIQRNVIFGLIDTMIGTGNVCSLFLGISVLSFVEGIYLYFIRLPIVIMRRKKQRKRVKDVGGERKH